MADGTALLRDAVEAALVRPPLSFSWFETSAGSIPAHARRGLSEAQLRVDLEERLALTLYARFYRSGRAVPGTADGGVRPDAAFVRELSRANRGSGCREPGWTMISSSAAGAVFAKGGLAFTVRDAARRRAKAPLVLPKELLRFAPGFYTALGDFALHPRARITRVYWNVNAAGAAPLVAATTRLLNREGIPFRMKVANHPSGFARCDAGVVYVRRRDIGRIWPLLAVIRRRVASVLDAATPAFTKTIAPGVAVADAPPGGGSFGMDRCRIVAGALVAAATKKESGLNERLLEVENAFRRHGLDPERPFLNPRSNDVYRPLPS